MRMTSICPRCGTSLAPGDEFCPQCSSEPTVRETGPGAGREGARLEASALESLRDVTLGEFEILKVLGLGGMAIVFLAHDLSLNRKVAIKALSPHLGADRAMRERFRREAQTAAGLSHPNIIPIYAVRETERIAYLVMKFVAGRSLESVIEEMGQLPIDIVVAALTQVAGGLGYGHRRGVVHRDVKPGNVMIDEDGTAVLTDFGIAQVEDAQALTQTGAAIGTPAYMSPEQCRGHDVGGASDQYSLGIVAYRMLAGCAPFERETAMATMYAHVYEPPPSLLDLRPDCPKPLYDAVRRMLAKEPQHRLPTMEDVIAAIGGAPLASDHPTRATMISLAAQGHAARVLADVSTPKSPIPATGSRRAAAARGPSAVERARSAVERARAAAPSIPKRRRKGLGLATFVIVVSAAVGLAVLRPWESRDTSAEQTRPREPSIPPPAVVADITLEAPATTLRVGESLELTARVEDAEGAPLTGQELIWEVSDASVAAVSPAGVLTGLSEGGVRVTVGVGSHSATVTFAVLLPAPLPPIADEVPEETPPAVAYIEVTPSQGSVRVGGTLALSATARDASDSRVAGIQMRWRSSNRSVARVSSTGVVRGLRAGTATISASGDGQRGEAVIRVRAPPPTAASLEILSAPQSLQVGQSLQLRARVLDQRGAEIAGQSITWSTSRQSVAAVTRAGLLTAVGPGIATITAESGGARRSFTITVTAAPRVEPTEEESRAAIAGLVAEYARALESRNVERVRRVYPSMTPSTAENWRRFFSTVSDLRVTLKIDDLVLQGRSARAAVSGTYIYAAAGRTGLRQAVSLPVTFTRSGSDWTIRSIGEAR